MKSLIFALFVIASFLIDQPTSEARGLFGRRNGETTRKRVIREVATHQRIVREVASPRPKTCRIVNGRMVCNAQ